MQNVKMDLAKAWVDFTQAVKQAEAAFLRDWDGAQLEAFVEVAQAKLETVRALIRCGGSK